jgi:hypothetical protein
VKLPPHINLRIEHQPHALDYQSVVHWLDRVDVNASHEILPDDRAQMLATGEVWTIDWCPDTPVGSCSVAAATLERALALAGGEP